MRVGVVVVQGDKELVDALASHVGGKYVDANDGVYVVVIPSASSYDAACSVIEGGLSELGDGDTKLEDLSPSPPN